jgi:transposase
LYSENIGSHICIDEVALTQGELYTVVTNASAACQNGSLIAMVKGTKSEEVVNVLKRIPLRARQKVQQVTVDLARNMEKIGRESFPNSSIISDRFHVQQLPTEALQEMRITYRWEAIKEENEAIKKAKESGITYTIEQLENGDTKKQLLARSRYLLFKPPGKWTPTQNKRAKVLFKYYPELKRAYLLTMMFRNIYRTAKTVEFAKQRLQDWYQTIEKYGYESFITAAYSIRLHEDTILSYFVHRKTNALAETFNSKIKAFRSIFRGVRDLAFFLFRVSKIFA